LDCVEPFFGIATCSAQLGDLVQAEEAHKKAIVRKERGSGLAYVRFLNDVKKDYMAAKQQFESIRDRVKNREIYWDDFAHGCWMGVDLALADFYRSCPREHPDCAQDRTRAKEIYCHSVRCDYENFHAVDGLAQLWKETKSLEPWQNEVVQREADKDSSGFLKQKNYLGGLILDHVGPDKARAFYYYQEALRWYECPEAIVALAKGAGLQAAKNMLAELHKKDADNQKEIEAWQRFLPICMRGISSLRKQPKNF
jgi:hypothetical protein